jgi:hypothetical protein
MPIDDSFGTVTIAPDGTFTAPNANALFFSLVPGTGGFPVEAVLDDDEKNPITVDSPRYATNGTGTFTKLHIRNAVPGTTFKLRLLTNPEAGERGRALTNSKGHLLTAPPGVVWLFDLDSSTESGRAGLDAILTDYVAYCEANGSPTYNLSRTYRISPGGQARRLPTYGEANGDDTILLPGAAVDVSYAREVVFGCTLWGEPDGDATRLWPVIYEFTPKLILCDSDNGSHEVQLDVGDFGDQQSSVISQWGLHGVASTGFHEEVDVSNGAPGSGGTANPRYREFRTKRRPPFCRFELGLRWGDNWPIDYFKIRRDFLRLYAYAVV